MTNRRKFLERSVLGAGSVLFLPGLLGSCTDHRIPDPDIPPSDDYPADWNWNDAAKEAVSAGIGMVPEVGDILSKLVDIFWPENKPSVWDQVKTQLETYVNQKIGDFEYELVSEDLGSLLPIPSGLVGSISLYLHAVADNQNTPGNGHILLQWTDTKTLFVNELGHFQSKDYKLPLLGLFGQYANMYLALLRDGVAFGKSWGMSDAEMQRAISDLKTAITVFSTYTLNTYTDGRNALLQKTPANAHLCEPFRTVNAYDRSLALTVLDFMDTWPYYDVTLYPDGAINPDKTKINVIKREIYSDPYGSCDDSGPIVIVTPVPTQFPTQLTVWGGDRIDAVQLTYPAGSGPGGVTQTPRMGDQPYGNTGGSNQPPYGGVFNLSPANPIIQVKVTSSDVVNAFHFKFNDGTVTDKLGGNYPEGTDLGWQGLTNGALSSIHINGISRYKSCADSVVFGFKFWLSPKATLRAIGALYVTSPKERSVADFAKSFPNLAISANLITDELKAARRAYWALIEARAKALK